MYYNHFNNKHVSYNLMRNRHIKPRNNSELGYFLAGLIDADGSICTSGYTITVNCHIRDISVAKYIKAVLHGGGVYRYKKVNGCYFYSHKKGATRLAHLIADKLQLPRKIKQFNERLAPRANSELCNVHTSNIRDDNHWFAGFVQGDGSFQFRIRKPGKPGWGSQVEILLSIEIKQECLLKRIQATFGGHVGFRKSRNTYYYTSVNLTNAQKLMTYFDRYQVTGPSYRMYLCWRRALLLVLEKKHLTDEGLEEIRNLKAYLTRLRS